MKTNIKKKQAQNTPDIYQGLISDVKNLRRCLIEDINGVYSLFDSPKTLESLQSYEALIKPTIAKRWDCFDRFVEQVNEQTLLCYHENLFSAPEPKKQDRITTQLMVWHKLCSLVKNSAFAKDEATPRDPSSGRKSSIGNCLYFHGKNAPNKTETGDLKTYQALKSLELFRQCIGNAESVNEATLKQFVIDNAAVLKTRQDPWRIFQYYRPTIIAAGLIRRN